MVEGRQTSETGEVDHNNMDKLWNKAISYGVHNKIIRIARVSTINTICHEFHFTEGLGVIIMTLQDLSKFEMHSGQFQFQVPREG
eukprot:11286145-Ditylum_brightwellii.AAC.1